MYKKISFIGIILAILLLTINSAFAAIPSVTFAAPTAVTGIPGNTVTVNYTATNAVASAKTLTFASTALSFVTSVTPTISSVTVPAASGGVSGTATVTFTVAIPSASSTGNYVGTITATESGTSNTDNTVTYTVTVAKIVQTYDKTTALEILGEEGQTNLTGTFQIKNTGNQVLSGLTFDTAALDLKDRGDRTITLTFSDPGTINVGETKTVTITANFDDSIDLDTYGGVVNVKTGATTLDSFKLDLKVFPEICSDGIVKDGDKASRTTAFLQLNVKEPDNGDDFKPGDEIKIEVDVENDDKDNLDVVVEAILYNLDEDEDIVTLESDSQEIKDGNDETFEFELEVPRDFDGDEDDRYVLFVKAVEDGDEDQNCNYNSINLDFKREKDDVIVRKATLLPNIAKPGDVVELVVEMENVGSNDQRDLYVEASNTDLGISLKSTEFDLDKSGDSNDDLTRRFNINIPTNAVEKEYTIDVAVIDDNDDTYDNGQAFVTLTVRGEGSITITPGKTVGLNVASNTKEIDASKGTANIHLQFTNSEANDVTAVVDIKTIGDWADAVISQTVSLHPGDNNLYFNLKLKDIDEGTYSATVTVKPAVANDFDAKIFTLNFDVKGGQQAGPGFGNLFNGNGSTTVFWIVGDIILVVIALLIIKSVFFGKK